MNLNQDVATNLIGLLFDEENNLKPEAVSLIPDEVEEVDHKSYLLNTLAPLQLPTVFIAENATSYSKSLLVMEGHYDDIIITNDYPGFADMFIDMYLQGGMTELDQHIIATIFEDTVVSEFVKINLAAEMLTRTYKKIGLVGSGKIDVGEDSEEYLHALLSAYEEIFATYGGLLIKGFEEDILEYESLYTSLMDWSWLIISTMASHIEVPTDVCTRLNDSILAFAISKIDDATMIRNMIKLYDNCIASITITGGYSELAVQHSPIPHKIHEGPGESNKLTETPDHQVSIETVIENEPITTATILVANSYDVAKSLFTNYISELFPTNLGCTEIRISKFVKEDLEEYAINNSIVLIDLQCEITVDIAEAINEVTKLREAVIIVSSEIKDDAEFAISESMSVVYNKEKLIKKRPEIKFPKTIELFKPVYESGIKCIYDAELMTKIVKENTGIEISDGYLSQVHEIGMNLAAIIRRDYSTVLDREVIFELTLDDTNKFYINDHQIVIVLHVDDLNDQLHEDNTTDISDEIMDNFDFTVLSSLNIDASPRSNFGVTKEPSEETKSIESLKEKLFHLTNGSVTFSMMQNMSEKELELSIKVKKEKLLMNEVLQHTDGMFNEADIKNLGDDELKYIADTYKNLTEAKKILIKDIADLFASVNGLTEREDIENFVATTIAGDNKEVERQLKESLSNSTEMNIEEELAKYSYIDLVKKFFTLKQTIDWSLLTKAIKK